MDSIWTKTETIDERPSLHGTINADVVVVGAGIFGILTAYYLQKAGKKVVVVEGNRIASGQTKNTTAKITSQHGIIYSKLLDMIGEESAKFYAMANEQAIKDYETLVQEETINCDFEKTPAYIYTNGDTTELKREANVAKSFGIEAEFIESLNIPVENTGAVCFHNQAQFHPIKFIKKLAKQLDIYEQSKVKKVEEHAVLGDNFKVEAKQIVLATHYPFLRTPGYYFLRMHQERTYLLSLANANKVNGMYLGNEDGHTMRDYGQYVLFGGGSHRTGENKEGGRYQKLEQESEDYFKGSKVVAQWSAQDCMTLDGIPYIGHFSNANSNWFVGTGFGKWGMTSSMVGAKLITDLATGNHNPYDKLFTPQRFHVTASMKNLLHDGMQAVKGLSKEFLSSASSELSALAPGHGGIISHNGEKYGVYRDEKGETHFVSTKCPHLGCELTYNPDEKSFDCPCHGSRFDYKGNLIDEPAMTGVWVTMDLKEDEKENKLENESQNEKEDE